MDLHDGSVKMISACGGALVTSLLFTPLDVVKVRMQAETPAPRGQATPAAMCEFCPVFTVSNGLMDHANVPKSSCGHFVTSPDTGRWVLAPEHRLPPAVRSRGVFQTAVHISRHEGFRALYSGVAPTLAMAVPATVLYFTLYEEFKAASRTATGATKDADLPFVAFLLSGMTAGGAASFATNPLDLVKLRLQVQRSQRHAATPAAAHTGVLRGEGAALKRSKSSPPENYRGMWDGLVRVSKAEGVRGLWRGAGARMLFHAPASAITIASFEHCRLLWSSVLHPSYI